MPTFQGLTQQAGVPRVVRSMPTAGRFQSGESPIFEYPYSIAGVTRDSMGAARGSCVVKLFRTADDTLVNQTISDGSGIFITPASNLLQHYIVSYAAGSPDITGATVNTIVGS